MSVFDAHSRCSECRRGEMQRSGSLHPEEILVPTFFSLHIPSGSWNDGMRTLASYNTRRSPHLTKHRRGMPRGLLAGEYPALQGMTTSPLSTIRRHASFIQMQCMMSGRHRCSLRGALCKSPAHCSRLRTRICFLCGGACWTRSRANGFDRHRRGGFECRCCG
jgi:hypothetical protein